MCFVFNPAIHCKFATRRLYRNQFRRIPSERQHRPWLAELRKDRKRAERASWGAGRAPVGAGEKQELLQPRAVAPVERLVKPRRLGIDVKVI
jgi:hypothetical protein